jgi:hypothetical protein
MPMSAACILYLAAFVLCLVSAMGKCPLWVPALLVCVAGLLGCLGR